MPDLTWGHLFAEALDEIYKLRKLLAEEWRRVDTDLAFARYPKSRRNYAISAVDRMNRASRGLSFPTASYMFEDVVVTPRTWRDEKGFSAEDVDALLGMAYKDLQPVPTGTCREVLKGGGTTCDEQAAYLLWGRLFPESALGPRCIEHTRLYTNGTLDEIDQWAVFDLRDLYRDRRPKLWVAP